MRPHGSQEDIAKRRQLAVKLLKQGLKPKQVAETLEAHVNTVYQWQKKFRQGGKKALAAVAHPTRKSALTPGDRKKLSALLLQGPQAHGYQDQLWTLERIAKLIRKQFGVKFHPSWVWKILQKMGWSCQQPQRVPREQHPRAVKEYRQQQWPKQKRQAGRGKKDGRLH